MRRVVKPVKARFLGASPKAPPSPAQLECSRSWACSASWGVFSVSKIDQADKRPLREPRAAGGSQNPAGGLSPSPCQATVGRAVSSTCRSCSCVLPTARAFSRFWLGSPDSGLLGCCLLCSPLPPGSPRLRVSVPAGPFLEHPLHSKLPQTSLFCLQGREVCISSLKPLCRGPQDYPQAQGFTRLTGRKKSHHTHRDGDRS